LFDKNGMASTRLAAAVGYPGTSVAFAQLLSGMERSGLIEREVRGKRTYRITPGGVTGLGPVRGDGSVSGRAGGSLSLGRGPVARIAVAARSMDSGGAVHGTSTLELDYDELARRLLDQLVRRLAEAEAEPPPAAGRLAEENVRLRAELRAAQESLARLEMTELDAIHAGRVASQEAG
jgi:DNA-binding PadR family transcriptional regulator